LNTNIRNDGPKLGTASKIYYLTYNILVLLLQSNLMKKSSFTARY